MDKKYFEDEIYYENDVDDEEFNLDLKKYFQVLLKRKWIILAITLIVTLPWLYYLKQQPPVYEASCKVRFRNLASGDENIIDDSRIIELTSRTFAEKVVAQLGLTLEILNDDNDEQIKREQLFAEFTTTKSPVQGQYVLRWQKQGKYSIHRLIDGQEELVEKGYIKDAMSLLHETQNGFSFKFASDITTLPNEIKFQINKLNSTVKNFQGNIHVRTTGGGGLLLLTMTDKNPQLVAQKVNRLAELYVDESKYLKKSAIETRKKTINEQLDFSKRELDTTDQALKDFKSRHKVSLGKETNEIVADLDIAEAKLESRKKQRQNLYGLLLRLDVFQNDPGRENRVKYVYHQICELSAFESNPNMGLLQKQLIGIEGEYNATVTTFSESNEKAIKLKGEIQDIYLQIKKEAKAQLAELDNSIADVTRERNELEYKIRRLPEEERQLTELERQLKAKEQINAGLLTQSQLTQLTDAVETEYIDILDPALIPEKPMEREKKKKAILGFMFGFMLGLGVAFTLEFLDKAIKTVDDVKKYLKLQVLGTIPNIDFKDIGDYQDSEKIKQIDQQLVTYDYSPTPIGEAYRSLRTNLVYSKNTGQVQSLVITSAAPGDGKSFTSANTAISMAQHKSNTLIIDGDLRRGVLHNTFGVPKEPGLTNYLTGMVSFQHLVNETLIPNLSLISCGSLLPNPSELLGSHQMQRFLDEAKRKYDIIIFDSPPLNAATDAIVIGTQVDAMVLVIRSGETNRDVAKQKLELFTNVPVRILGVVLNGTSAEFGHDGYSYYHY